MPVQFNSPVYLADAEAIQALLKADDIQDRVPIGYIEQSNNVKVPVCMEASWLTGPEGAHLNVSGKSRLAAKTSYVLFLVSALLQTQKDTAFVIFNVKGSDLLQIHKPNNLLGSDINQLSERDQQQRELLIKAWASMGLQAKPFDEDKVFYFLPSHKNNTFHINSDLRNLPIEDCNDILRQPNNYFVYRYMLPHARGKLRLLLSSQRPNDVQEQFISTLDNNLESHAWTKNSFSLLSAELQNIRRDAYYLGSQGSTIQVVKRFLDNLTNNRTTGVFSYEQATCESVRWKLPSDFIKGSTTQNQAKQLQAGQTLVVDITRLNEFEQQWVFADVLTSVEELMRSGGRGDLKKVVVVVDELNKYAPSGLSSPLTTDIVDITARGGSLGVILFGAEQFASRINPQVYGNCANKAFGLTDATETSTDPYRAFPREIKDRLSELQKGELILNVDFFGQPLRVKFPPPACRKQEDAS